MFALLFIATTPVLVTNTTELESAWKNLAPGSTIILKDGTYNLRAPLASAIAGTKAAPVTVRSQTARKAIIATAAEEAFSIAHPWYVFNGLTVNVAGKHAYKLNGATASSLTAASDIVIQNGRCVLEAASESCIKGATAAQAPYADRVKISGMEISFRAPSTNVVAEGIDAVGVAGWWIVGNTISNIRKADGVAYAIVLKGNSQSCIVEKNTIVDSDIAISVGGETAPEWFRDQDVKYEHRNAIVRLNTIARTKDVGIYLKKAYATQISNNIIIEPFTGCGTGCSSIDVRDKESTATIKGNALAKPVLPRDGGTFTENGTIKIAVSDFADYPRDLRLAASSTIRGVGALAAVVLTPIPLPVPPPPAAARVLVKETAHGLPGMYYGSMAAADFDGDGKIDLVMAGNYERKYDDADKLGGHDQVRLFRNVSSGSAIRFAYAGSPNVSGVRGSQVVVGDFDGDGKPDYAVEFRNGSDTTAFLNRGSWSFETSTIKLGFGVQSSGLGFAAGDVDKDGRADLVFLSDGYGTGPGLWYNYVNGAWQAHQTDFVHGISYGGSIALGDIDGDGFLDLAVSGNSSLPFGSVYCANLMIGGLHRGGAAGFSSTPLAILGNFGLKESLAQRSNIHSCHGSDNAEMAIADLDKDGHDDIVVAGSSTGFNGPPGLNGQQYDFAVLFNVDGTGKNFSTWEAVGPQSELGTTNGGPGNLDEPNLAIGDLTGDGWPDVFVQGHHRDYFVKDNPYIYATWLFVNNRDRTFTRTALAIDAPVGEGGEVIADFNGDGKPDLIFTGATIPFHSNGINSEDKNSAASLRAYVFR